MKFNLLNKIIKEVSKNILWSYNIFDDLYFTNYNDVFDYYHLEIDNVYNRFFNKEWEVIK